MDCHLAYDFIGFGAMDGNLLYELHTARGHGWPVSL